MVFSACAEPSDSFTHTLAQNSVLEAMQWVCAKLQQSRSIIDDDVFAVRAYFDQLAALHALAYVHMYLSALYGRGLSKHWTVDCQRSCMHAQTCGFLTTAAAKCPQGLHCS